MQENSKTKAKVYKAKSSNILHNQKAKVKGKGKGSLTKGSSFIFLKKQPKAMEWDGDVDELTPFWMQRTNSLRHVDRLRQRLSSIFFSSGLVVILLLVTAVSFLVFVVPSTLSFSAQIFRPNNVKKSWDSLNIVLVLAAVVFGFLSRNKNGDRYYDEYQTSPVKLNETQKSNPSTPHQWYDYSTNETQKSNSSQWCDQYSSDNENKLYKSSTMRRISSSYPDLRQFSSNWSEFSSNWSNEDDRRRFYDDIHVDTYRVPDSSQLHRRRRSLEEIGRENELNAKNIYVDTFVRRPKEVSDTPPLPAMPPLHPAQKPDSIEKPKRTYESVGRKKERSKVERNLDPGKPIAPPKIPPPPPPPMLQPKSGRSDRKRGGATGSATKEFLNSLYNKKKKKQRQRSVDNLDSLFHQTQTPALHFQLPPPSPPPPPPPPPPSVFHNIFSSKKPKRKGHIIVTPPIPAPIPPPPPPPPKAEREPKPSTQIVPLTTHKLPELVKMNRFENADENSNSGGESPLMTMPPPPPFFKAPAWKFVVQGDYVRIDSNASSRSGSPEPDEMDSDITPSSIQGGDMSPFHPSPAFCPSPDVNTKAESFITNFRAKLKLEKVHSMSKRELGLSNLRPGPGPT
ncbi:unnamed protein product [Fraxinus pennsylvanica]|uniref:Hydroxyproline-rich glycoprotein family protein n=1 Tax=Fraxinus pennsylvanica TaxID=56036 RepID=A0AAD1ZAI8_9LAMI|nr:unnamed protein product [Fraxinus pennsylvanica]